MILSKSRVRVDADATRSRLASPKTQFLHGASCTDSSNKALRESRLCISITIRVVTLVPKGYTKGSHHCMTVYCEPWLPSERISMRYGDTCKTQLQNLRVGRTSRDVATHTPMTPTCVGLVQRVPREAHPRMTLQRIEQNCSWRVQRVAHEICMHTVHDGARLGARSPGNKAGPRHGGAAEGQVQRRGGRGGCLQPGIARVLLEYCSLRRRRRENFGHLISNFRV